MSGMFGSGKSQAQKNAEAIALQQQLNAQVVAEREAARQQAIQQQAQYNAALQAKAAALKKAAEAGKVKTASTVTGGAGALFGSFMRGGGGYLGSGGMRNRFLGG